MTISDENWRYLTSRSILVHWYDFKQAFLGETANTSIIKQEKEVNVCIILSHINEYLIHIYMIKVMKGFSFLPSYLNEFEFSSA